jgi:hypothetical protein
VKAEQLTTVRTRRLGPDLRSATRPAEPSRRESADLFAGEDDLWAPEDVVGASAEDAQTGAASVEFSRALFVIVAISAVGWAAFGGAAFALYQLLTA